MKNQRPMALADPLADELQDAPLTARLAAELGRLRPDPEDFAAGVAERIAAAEDSADRPVELAAPDFVRRAAAFLPPILLPKGLTKLGLGAGGAAASKLSFKFLPGLAALPAVTVVMLFVTLGLGLRSMFASGRAASTSPEQVADERAAGLQVAAWWRAHMLPTLVVAAGLIVLGLRAPVEAASLFLLVSLLALFGIFGRLAAAGFASRRELGQRAGGFLFSIAALALQFGVQDLLGLGRQAGAQVMLPVLLAAGLACTALARSNDSAELRRKGALAAGVWLILMTVLVSFERLVLEPLVGKWTVEAEDVRAWIEAGEDPQLADVARWDAIRASLLHLEAAGLERPDTSALGAVIHGTLDSAEDLAEFNFIYANEVARMGLARSSDLEAWRNEYVIERLFEKPGKPFGRQQDHLALRILMGAEAPDASVTFSAEQRALLVERILLRALDPPVYQGLEALLADAELLELLGRADAVDQLQQRAHEQLLATWAPSISNDQGAFAGSVDLVDRNAAGASTETRLSFVWVGTTSSAVLAMDRWGVPAGIDLLRLEAYLAEQSRQYRRQGVDSYHARAATALAHLRSMPEFSASVEHAEPLGPLQRLAELRLLLAVLLLSGFAVAATLRAPIVPWTAPERIHRGIAWRSTR